MPPPAVFSLPHIMPQTTVERNAQEGRENRVLPDVVFLLREQLNAQENVLKAQMDSLEKSRAILEAIQKETQAREYESESLHLDSSNAQSDAVAPESAPDPVPPYENGPDKASKLQLSKRSFNPLHYVIPHIALPQATDAIFYASTDELLKDNLSYFCNSRLLYHMLFATISIPIALGLEPTTSADVAYFELMAWAALTNMFSIGYLNYIQTAFEKVHLNNIRPWAAANRIFLYFQGIIDALNTWFIVLAICWKGVFSAIPELLPSSVIKSPASSALRAGLLAGRLAMTVSLALFTIYTTNIASVTAVYSVAMTESPIPRGETVKETASMFRAACIGGLNQGYKQVSAFMLHVRKESSEPAKQRVAAKTRRSVLRMAG